ncbi:RING-H2 finger protein ATL7 [Abeliophyllum distichum]|uniref:RING-type E3 ubiquitin transferase n=1 Tax=Abeliophyllum distichum TaxID=126358 RepID=A0ABD1S9Z3_9LAMI
MVLGWEIMKYLLDNSCRFAKLSTHSCWRGEYSEHYVILSRRSSRCSVCLADYQSDDKLQQIPACGHTFHMDCIDLWLATHTTCPLCRQSLLASSKAPDGEEEEEEEEEDIQVETNNISETSLGIISQSIEDDSQTSQQPLESSNADEKESLQPATACEEAERVS